MNNVISKIKILLLLAMVITMASCSGNEVEIIEQDTSWKIDDKYITDDIREQLGIDPFKELVYFAYSGSSLLQLEAVNDLKNTVIVGGEEISFRVRLTKPYAEDVAVKIVRDNELLKQFPVKIDEIPTLPESNYTLTSGVLKAGTKEAILTMNIKDANALTNKSGYVLALKLEMGGEHKGLAVAKTRFTYFMKLTLRVQLDNIDSSNTEVVGEGFNQGVQFESNRRVSVLHTLNDGNFTTNHWYTDNDKDYLTVVLPEKTLVKGFRFDTSRSATGSYMLKSCNVFVEMPDGEWLNNGFYDRESAGGVAYIRFKTPTECTKIRFEKMKAFNNRYSVDVNEVTVFK